MVHILRGMFRLRYQIDVSLVLNALGSASGKGVLYTDSSGQILPMQNVKVSQLNHFPDLPWKVETRAQKNV